MPHGAIGVLLPAFARCIAEPDYDPTGVAQWWSFLPLLMAQSSRCNEFTGVSEATSSETHPGCASGARNCRRHDQDYRLGIDQGEWRRFWDKRRMRRSLSDDRPRQQGYTAGYPSWLAEPRRPITDGDDAYAARLSANPGSGALMGSVSGCTGVGLSHSSCWSMMQRSNCLASPTRSSRSLRRRFALRRS